MQSISCEYDSAAVIVMILLSYSHSVMTDQIMCIQVTCTMQPREGIFGVSDQGHSLYRCEALILLPSIPPQPHDEIWGQQLQFLIRMLHLRTTIACLHSQLAPMCRVPQPENCNAAEQQGFCLDIRLPAPSFTIPRASYKPLRSQGYHCQLQGDPFGSGLPLYLPSPPSRIQAQGLCSVVPCSFPTIVGRNQMSTC